MKMNNWLVIRVNLSENSNYWNILHLNDTYESMDINSIRLCLSRRVDLPERLVALVLVMDLVEAVVAVAHPCTELYSAMVESLPTERYPK